jgi:hypothetical protein
MSPRSASLRTSLDGTGAVVLVAARRTFYAYATAWRFS